MAVDTLIEFEVVLHLPDALIREATQQGVLNSATLETLIYAEVKRRRIEQLFNAADQLAAQGVPELSEAEIEQEIHHVRAAKHS